MASANLQIIIDALDNASDDLRRLKQELGGIAQQGKNATKQTKKSDDSFKTLAQTAAKVTAAYFAVRKGAEFAYKTISEGADLEYAQTRFENLTASIGTTSNALLTDLRNATKGTRSDFELMASGADFMALGLAKSHDEAVRLTKVAGALGMNMNQLVLTLTNKTTMRFDALGVSVDGFKEKVKALEAAGLDADAAFKEAFLQQAEGQIARVGDRAETSAGQMDKLRASFANLVDGIKVALARDALPVVNEVTSELTRAGAGQQLFNKTTAAAKELGIEYKKLYDIVSVKTNWWDSNETITKGFEMGEKRLVSFMGYYAKFIEQGHSSAEALEKTDAVLKKFGNNVVVGKMTQEWANLNDRVWGATEAVDSFSAVNEGLAKQAEVMQAVKTDWANMSKMALAYNDVLGAISQNNSDMEKLQAIVDGTSKSFDGTAMSAAQAQSKIEELTSKGADLAAAMQRIGTDMTFSMLQASMAVDGYTRSEIKALTEFMVANGMITQEAATMMEREYAAAVQKANMLTIKEKVGKVLADLKDFDGKMAYVDGKIIEEKTGKVLADINPFLEGVSEAEAREIRDLIVKLLLDDSAVRNYNPPDKFANVTYHPRLGSDLATREAVGGPVIAAASGRPTSRTNTYLWQEHGYQGEIFVPSTNGYILSRADAAAAVSNSSTYNNGSTYHISAMYKQEPVLTLSQEMRIRSTLEALG